MHKFILISSLALVSFLTACSEMEPKPFVPSTGHIDAEVQPTGEIPELVTQAPVLAAPAPAVELEKYTVVVNEVPVKELLFALARDAQVNVDIDPTIEGLVTINAVEQTLPQILDRIAHQVDLKYTVEEDNLIVSPDIPYFETYNIGYLNLSRETTGSVTVSTQIQSTSSGEEGSSGGGNTSTTDIKSESNHNFWENLKKSIAAFAASSDDGEEDSLITIPEAGLLTVKATASQHAEIQKFLDRILNSVRRQVLIQATIVEVELSDQYQAGIDWSIIDLGAAGFSIASTLLGGASIIGGAAVLPGLAGPPTTSSGLVLDYLDEDASGNQLHAAVGLLQEFGNARVLSSPQIMVLNNHTAVLKVVENFVYFEVEQEIESGNAVTGTGPLLATTTTAKTIPVGLVMTVTPQVSIDDSVILNVRPTISSVVRTELDPNPSLTLVENRIPVVRVREMESILKVNSSQVAVLGGLMQDASINRDKETPGLSKLPMVGDFFKSKNRESLKSELVIFMRPTVIRNASLDGDLSAYRKYLDAYGESIAQPAGSEAQ